MNDPACTCPVVFRRMPHKAVCPRWDEDRAWSIEDRQEQMGRDLDAELTKILGGAR